jgi:hypothetical protein
MIGGHYPVSPVALELNTCCDLVGGYHNSDLQLVWAEDQKGVRALSPSPVA